MIFSHPEHWVRLAGSRIVKLHTKDFRLDLTRCRFSFGKIGQGAVDWAAVRTALLQVEFSGYITNTGIPRRRPMRWIDRAMRDSRSPVAFVRALSVGRRPADMWFLRDVSRRFDEFQNGSLR
jgi:sugar phosphate isomerase/epimerase